MRLLKDLLPADVRVRETTGDFGHLLVQERDYFRVASAKRLREATTVRACARELLDATGFHDYALVPGPDGGPTWPMDVVGSLTHCRGFRAAAIGTRQSYKAIGIDVEPAIPLSETTLEAVLCTTDTSAVTHPLWSTILFSAKEAAFKAWSGAGVTGLHAFDISIALEVSGHFRATAPTQGQVTNQISGRWTNRHDHIATAAVIRQPNREYLPGAAPASSLALVRSPAVSGQRRQTARGI